MKILILNLEFDCAGVGWTLRNAINDRTDHLAYHVAHRQTFAAKNTDFRFNQVEELIPYCEWADVLHFNQWIWTHRPGNAPMAFLKMNEYGKGHPFTRFVGEKKFVFHFHGGPHQIEPSYWIEEARKVGAGLIKCDPISFPRLPQVRWLPNIIPLDLAPAHMQADPLMVAIMGDKEDIRRNNNLLHENLRKLAIEHSFFGSIPYEQALEARRNHQISIDNTTQGFVGMWSWESMAMGQPVLARLDPKARKAYESLCPDCPIIETPNVDLAAQEAYLLSEDQKSAKRIGDRSREWVRIAMEPTSIVNRYIDFYENI